MKTTKKQFGQFFTEPRIANLMVRWALKNNPKNFLDPAVGPGVFPQTVFGMKSKTKITVVEYEPEMVERYKQENHYKATLVEADYLTWKPQKKFDSIVANPPYNKFQAIPNRLEYIDKFAIDYNIKLSGYTNQCIYFLVKSMNELSLGGRCCYIIPYEFMNTGYGTAVKQYLINSKMLKGILKFDQNDNLFFDAQTTSCILFLENKVFDGCFFINSDKISDLESFDFDEYAEQNKDTLIKYDKIDSAEKWISYFGEPKEEMPYKNLVSVAKIGKVKRGIATGSNEFFTLNRSKISTLKLSEKTCLPCVTKSPDIKVCIFDDAEFKRLEKLDKKVYLFDGLKASTKHDKEYILYGESQEYDKAFLTSHRTPWYLIENKPVAPIWVSVFSREKIKVIRNEAKIKNLTTFHGFYLNDFNEDEINILFCYLLTPIATEILKRNKREYGSGLDKFEPGDLNKSFVIDVKSLSRETKDFVIGKYNDLKKDQSKLNSIVNELNDIFKKILL